ncbi:MAG: hypothetical protein P4L55_15490 [Syntrophobacteraceae bacterium]|nr:hypothetical protein [Syntrophobacteraceae bacterium]
MSDSIVYNIPITMIEAYRGRTLVVRSHDPSMIVQRLAGHDLEMVEYLQVPVTGGDIDSLLHWEHAVPVDLVIHNPEADLPLLYRYSAMQAARPVRVSVPVAPGFSKVVKLALSLDFAVKLEFSQPGPALTEELLRVADLYLHQSTVSQPVEFIHSMFLAFYKGDPVALWIVQEEDPARMRYITARGIETISRRFAGVELNEALPSFIENYIEGLIKEEGGECNDCEFFDSCLGYFKWPRKEYLCEGVKALFQRLKEAAEELKADLSSFHSPKGENRS